MGTRVLASLARRADTAGRWAAIALGFSIPISVALDNMLLALVLACWLIGGAFRATPTIVKDNGVVLAALVLYGLLVLGSFYGDRAPGDAGRHLVKYADLLFIPVFVSMFRDPVDRLRAMHALAASLGLVLVLSYLLKFGLVPKNVLMAGDAASPTVFKLRVAHNILMAFGAFLFASLALNAASAVGRLAWACLAVLAVINVTLMVKGATGYLILGALALLFGYGCLRARGVGLAAGGLAAVVAILLIVPGPFQQRITGIGAEIGRWQPGARSETSAGQRLEFYRNTLPMIAEHPIIGTGTGSFPKAYADRIRGTESLETRNPHGEFLHITVQLGLIGLAALVYLFFRQWQLSRRLATPVERQLARGLVATLVIGCLLNSLLLDHTEGLFYAWLTGVLYAGLESGTSPPHSAA